MTGTCHIPDLKMLAEPSPFASWFQAIGLDPGDGITSQPSEFYAATSCTPLAQNSGLRGFPRVPRPLVAMKGTKILWGQVLLVGAVVLAFIWAATEWTAWRLAFQPELGRPWFAPFGWPFYAPPAFFWWWFAYDAYAPEIFVEGAYIAASGAIAGIVVAVTMSVWRAREAKTVTTYGSARWAESREIRHAGLFHAEGVVLGRWRGAYLHHEGPEHVLCFAPTRSGKGVGLVVPTLLTWLGDRPRHQGRELGLDRRLAVPVRPGAHVRSDQRGERRL
jgi:Type IV secretory system Conjugative DNA transfer